MPRENLLNTNEPRLLGKRLTQTREGTIVEEWWDSDSINGAKPVEGKIGEWRTLRLIKHNGGIEWPEFG